MASITLFRMRPAQLKSDALMKIARHLGIEAKPQEVDEGIAMSNEKQALVYSRSCAKFSGVLFFIDQMQNLAEPVKKPLEEKKAKGWADDFLKNFNLLPKPSEDKRIQLKLDTASFRTDGIVFDGKERKRVPIKTEIASDISLNSIQVVGPRAKIRMIFKEMERPAFIHRGLWESLEIYEERELVREHDAVEAVREKLARRSRCGEAYYDITEVRLAYFAREFQGGPDLLAPYYFVEVEHRDEKLQAPPNAQQPKHVVWFPAFR
jgi:hypothetical protein